MYRGQKHRRTRHVAFLAITTLALIGLALPVLAMEPLVIPVDTVVRGAEGEVHRLAEIPTGSEAGCVADVHAMSANNESVHVGNDLIVSSGGASVIIPDVESAPGATIEADGTLTLGESITVDVRLGPADPGRPGSVFSGGVTVTIKCRPVETTTTTEATTTTTEATTTTTEATTTTTEATTTTTEPTTTTTATPPSSVLGTSTTTLPPVTASTLPFTGAGDLVPIGLAGAATVLLGVALLLSARSTVEE
ncbi:MAG: hypothetical protein OEW91_13360 [Acidimicrobiia bacterium]|nr:hypothetical protein [Acidimicrobiia bacterium]